jgi:plasmid stabilization system protein ParE
MAFRIRAAPLALADIDERVRYYASETSASVAAKWLNGIVGTVMSLQEMPKRCPFATENDDLEFEARQILYKSHRVVFCVEQIGAEGIVHVLRVYHQALTALTAEDFDSMEKGSY